MEGTFFPIDPRLLTLAARAEQRAAEAMDAVARVTRFNQEKVLAAFQQNRVSESHFAATTGYGYGDRGRDVLDAVFAQAMGAEDALVRHFLLCGTHALTVALFGVLRPGDTMLAATGAPYDTLQTVIGLTGNGAGSLREFGVGYRQADLTAEGLPDLAAVERILREEPTVRLVHIQRSRGYCLRPSLTVAQIGTLIAAVRRVRPDVIVFVDNCYGEFAETTEPTAVGADLMAGSLIKNPGGGIAENGGYICGRHDLVEQCAYRLTTPGLGREVGASLGHNRTMFMGLFAAPHVTGEALKTAIFCASLFDLLGFAVSPGWKEARADIIQTVSLRAPQALTAFCRGIQRGAPIDAFVVPEAWDMPGYDDQVVMAAGAFTMGASIELSADGPMREPYAAFMQGSLSYDAGRLGVLLAAQSMLDEGFLQL